MADIVVELLNSSLFMGLLMLVVLFFILRLFMNRKKDDPSKQPWWGRKVRAKETQAQLEKRSDFLGVTAKLVLYRGWDKLGKVKSVETVYRNRKVAEKQRDGSLTYKPSGEIIELYHVKFYRLGKLNYIKAYFGFGFKYMVCDPQVVTVRPKQKTFEIHPQAHIINDSGIWTVAKRDALEFIDDMMLKSELENMKGFVADFPRRLSNLSPDQAKATEFKSHEADLEEKKRKSRVSSWSG